LAGHGQLNQNKDVASFLALISTVELFAPGRRIWPKFRQGS